MKKTYGCRRRYLNVAVGLLVAGTMATAQDITKFEDGYLTFTNSNPTLYYRIEFKPNLAGSEGWDETYEGLTNIKTNTPTVEVPIGVFYRVVGTPNPIPIAPVTKTGAGDMPGYTETPGEDGHATMRKGVAWPNPRFTDNGDGTVTDNLTGLIWLKNASSFAFPTWDEALNYCATLNSGEHGLTDASSEGDWRLPNVRELFSLIDFGYSNPALCNTAGTGHWSAADPFNNPPFGDGCWSSTTLSSLSNRAFQVRVETGMTLPQSKSLNGYCWPVRGGK